MSCSFNWICTKSSRFGRLCTRPFNPSLSTSIQFGAVPCVSSISFEPYPDWSLRSTCGRDVALPAIKIDVTVVDHLAGLGAAGAEAHAEDDAVQAALQVLHQVLAGDALLQRCLLERDAELPFQHAVHTADFLLFAKLQAVAHNLLSAVLAMLSGDEVALLDGALFAVAALAFEV